MKLLKIIILLLLSLEMQAQNMFNLSETQWVEDIDFLAEKIEETIPDYTGRLNREEFESKINLLKQNLTSKSTKDIVWELQTILNMIGDDGCSIMPFQAKLETSLLPVKSYWFEDGLFICDASRDYHNLKGEQIIKINGVEISELFDKLSPFINADNDHYRKNLFPLYAITPSLLNSQGIGNSTDSIELGFKSGKTANLKATPLEEYRKLRRQLPNDGVFSLTNTNHEKQYYWLEYLPNSKTLFVQLQWIYDNKEDISFSGFVKKIEEEIEVGKATKLIVDLRYGGGGNGFKFKGFTDLLRDSETINKKGNLFVLTSRETGGSILELTSVLELNTKAIFVGEPTGEGPNTVGDTKQIILPNSGLSVSLTKIFWATSWASDTRKTIKPDLSISYSFSQYQDGQDPWLDKVMQYSASKPLNNIPKELSKSLVGSYKIAGRKIVIEEQDGKLIMSMKRPIRSFFEINTELYTDSSGILSTDIHKVSVLYNINENGKSTLSGINWKGVFMPANN